VGGGISTVLALSDRIRSTEAMVETTKADAERSRVELQAGHAAALEEAKAATRAEAQAETEARIAEAQRQAQAEREAMAKAHDEALAMLRGDYESERDGFVLRAEAAERDAREALEAAQREAARADEALARDVPKPAPEPFLYSVEAEPHKDAAGRWSGMTLKSPVQTIRVEVVRDGAGEPRLLRIKPKGA
jgi:colicin import membrane protein